MKKFISLFLAIVLTLSMSVTAFAADASLPHDGATGQSTVTYRVESSFCVIIPETLDGMNGFQLTADFMNITESEKVCVYVNSDDGKFTLTNESGDTMEASFNTSGANGAIGIFTKGQTQSDVYCCVMPSDDTIPKAGEYSGTVEFIVRLEPNN